jgi:hypothetical protein
LNTLEMALAVPQLDPRAFVKMMGALNCGGKFGSSQALSGIAVQVKGVTPWYLYQFSSGKRDWPPGLLLSFWPGKTTHSCSAS